jgi:hypothetical protein
MLNTQSALQVSAPVVSSPPSSALPELNIPKFLTLRFTSARDLPAITSLFNGYRKQQMDPAGQIRERSFAELSEPITSGRAIIAEDEHDDIRFIALASHHLDEHSPERSFIEIGAVMCDVKGFNLAQTAISALSAKSSKGAAPIHALVSAKNIAPQKIFGKHLGWNAVQCENLRTQLYDTQKRHSSPLKRASKLWFNFGQAAQDKAEDFIQRTKNAGALISKTGQKIELHFSHAEMG